MILKFFYFTSFFPRQFDSFICNKGTRPKTDTENIPESKVEKQQPEPETEQVPQSSDYEGDDRATDDSGA